MEYTQNGNYLALAGLVVLMLSKLGLNVTVDTIMVVVGGIVALIGIVKQFIDHRKLAVATGAYHK